MQASPRPGEITYYEELGVETTASPDEIRDAFRALARLLHPDQQTDPQLKEMAERQMRKLNRIYAVLSDEVRRAAYNQAMNAPRTAPVIVFSGAEGSLKNFVLRVGLVTGIALGVVALIWMAFSNTAEVRGQDGRGAPSKSSDSSDGDSSEQIARLREQLRATETERNSALQQLARLGQSIPDSNLKENPPKARSVAATALSELPSGATSGVPANDIPASHDGAPTASVPVSQFAGHWVAGKTPGSASAAGKSQYPPDFIELALSEQNGTLHGQYNSRYQVLDHASSPDVDFTFDGTPRGSSLSAAWRGNGGSRGHVTVKLSPSGSLDVAWSATELGSEQWLLNGSATLVRKP